MSATLLPNAESQFLDANGKPLCGGSVYMYIPNTSTFKATWKDSAQTILNTNPIILDGGGRAIIWGSGTYRQVVYDQFNNLIWDQTTESFDSSISGDMTDNTFVAAHGDYTPGTTTQLTLSRGPGSTSNMWVFFDALFQGPDTYTVAGSVVTFNAPIPVGVQEVYIKTGNTLSIGTPSDGTVTDASVASGTKLYNRIHDLFDVKDFGAKGDGVTDDSMALQRAINYVQNLPTGGRLYAPTGKYIVNTQLSIQKTNSAAFLFGGDGNSTIFKCGPTLPAGPLFNIGVGSSAPGGGGMYISDMYVQEPDSEASGFYAFQCLNANQIHFENVLFGAVDVGVYLSSCYATRYTNCQFLNTKVWGVYSSTSAHNLIMDKCSGFGVGGITGHVLRLDGATNNIVMQNCDWEQCSVIYSLASGSTSVLVTGCYIEYTVNVEFFHQGPCYSVSVENCWIAFRTTTTGYLNWLGGRFSGNTINGMTCRFDPATCDNVLTDGNILQGTGAMTGKFLRDNGTSAFFDGNSAALGSAYYYGCTPTYLSSGRVRITFDVPISFQSYFLTCSGIGVSNGTNWCVPGIVTVAADGSYADIGAIVTGLGTGSVPEMHLSLLVTKVQ